jgi:hypothetical protein
MPQPANQTNLPAPLRWLRTIALELYSLFVDDGLFAAAILLWLALTLIAAHTHLSPRWRAFGLVAGLLAILVESLVRFTNSRRK